MERETILSFIDSLNSMKCCMTKFAVTTVWYSIVWKAGSRSTAALYTRKEVQKK